MHSSYKDLCTEKSLMVFAKTHCYYLSTLLSLQPAKELKYMNVLAMDLLSSMLIVVGKSHGMGQDS
jgi:hypothetical protein